METVNFQNLKNEFIELMMSTNRKGVVALIEKLDQRGFFVAPASSKFHLCYNGGLLEHSINVCHAALVVREQMIRLDSKLESLLPIESVIISSLLHDVCKADIYKKTVKKQKTATGLWEEVEGYDIDGGDLPVGHGEKSVIVLLQMGFELSNEEILAIRWHMQAWDLAFQSYESKSNLNEAKAKCPLCSLIQCADGLASNLLEHKY